MSRFLRKKRKNNADKLKGSIGRVIESNADHPGLLLLRALLEIKSGHYDESLVCNDIEAAFTFAIERYSVKVSVCTIHELLLLFYSESDLEVLPVNVDGMK